jgi:hypothetical protein
MPRTPTVPERLDRALEQLLAGLSPSAAAATAGFDAPGRTLLETADRVRAGLLLPPVAPRFEARLGARLAAASGDSVAWVLRHPGRLIVTGAVGSAVGVGVTAYAVWRSTRRSSTVRFLHR